MTKTVPDRIQRRLADLDDRIAILCTENIDDSDVVMQAQGRIRDREATVVQLQTEVEIIRMGIAAWSGAVEMVEGGDAVQRKVYGNRYDRYFAAEATEQKSEPSQPDSTEPPTAQSQILRLLAEANRPMKAREIITTFSDRYGETSITSALSRLKRNQLITHLSESSEWAIR